MPLRGIIYAMLVSMLVLNGFAEATWSLGCVCAMVLL
jgi:hypothetical protein